MVPIAAIIMIAALVSTLVHFRKFSPYKLPSSVVGNPQIVLSLDDVQIVGRSDGHKIFSFMSKRADVSRGRYTTLFYAIRDGKLYDNEKPVAFITAGTARYDSISKSVEVTDGVKVSSIQGYLADAEQAMWSSELKLLTCPGKVVFSARGNQLVGENLVADLNNRVATLEKARMEIDISEVDTEDSGKSKSQASGG